MHPSRRASSRRYITARPVSVPHSHRPPRPLTRPESRARLLCSARPRRASRIKGLPRPPVRDGDGAAAQGRAGHRHPDDPQPGLPGDVAALLPAVPPHHRAGRRPEQDDQGARGVRLRALQPERHQQDPWPQGVVHLLQGLRLPLLRLHGVQEEVHLHHRRRLLRGQGPHGEGHRRAVAAHQEPALPVHAALLQHPVRPLRGGRRLRARLPLQPAGGRADRRVARAVAQHPRLRRPHAAGQAPGAQREVRERRDDHPQGHPLPHVRHEPRLRPRPHRPRHVLRPHGRRPAHRTLRRHVGRMVRQGDLRSPGAWRQDRAALHLAQQGQQPVRQPQEGVQGHLLAGGHHPLLPGRRAAQGLRHRAKVLHRALATGQGQARQGRPLLHQARRRHGHLDRGLGLAQLRGARRR
ncbi:hypothetical protein U9M48_017640 [Paspalum notatum var. saurae]|uniref:Uncharacterized protein n=1 Tax=Paspalum notatum var. saurae TaxID=547442 RepID=A0AAQ3T888_PASNO